MNVLEGVSAAAVGATLICWNAITSEKRRRHHRRAMHKSGKLPERCDNLSDSVPLGDEGSAVEVTSISGLEEVEPPTPSVAVQASPQIPSTAPCCVKNCRASRATSPPSTFSELVVILDGPPLSPLPQKLPELPEEADWTGLPQESMGTGNATTFPEGCDLSHDFHSRVPSPPRLKRHRRRHTFSGNRSRTFSVYTPDPCAANERQHRAGKVDDFEGWSLSQLAMATNEAYAADANPVGEFESTGRCRFATFSNSDASVEELGP